MKLQTTSELNNEHGTNVNCSNIDDRIFSKDYVDFLNEAGWRLEKKFPSNCNNYSDLLEDTEWESIETVFISSKHYRRDLDALS